MPENDPPAEVTLFTDGACSGNPGPGGWAYILRHGPSGKEKEVSGCEAETTNNRMELLAVIEGLEALKRACRVELVTDSEYVGKGITQWMPKWKRNHWRRGGKPNGPPVKNVELWKRLDAQIQRHQVDYTPVLGHTGHVENERCDELAVQAYRELMQSRK